LTSFKDSAKAADPARPRQKTSRTDALFMAGSRQRGIGQVRTAGRRRSSRTQV
jgi:hypothetical protein